MKILFLVSSLEGGGAERAATILSSVWNKRGHSVVLMATFSGRGTLSYAVDEGIVVDYLADHVNNSSNQFRRLFALRRYIVTVNPDVIVSFLPNVNIAALLATMGISAPVAACERIFPPLDESPLPPVYQILRRLLYRRAAVLVGQTKGVESWLHSIAPRAQTSVIPNALLLPIPKNRPVLKTEEVVSSERKIVLCVGRLAKQKRTFLSVRAFANLAKLQPDWDLVILGKGPEQKALTKLISQTGMTNRIHLPGFAGNLTDWYRRAEIFVLPSAFEGFPNALIEAMAHDLPTISFDVQTGPREITQNGESGILLPDSDHIDGLAKALNNLMSNPSKRADLGQKAGEVRRRYDLDSIADRWEDLLNRISKKEGRTPF